MKQGVCWYTLCFQDVKTLKILRHWRLKRTSESWRREDQRWPKSRQSYSQGGVCWCTYVCTLSVFSLDVNDVLVSPVSWPSQPSSWFDLAEQLENGCHTSLSKDSSSKDSVDPSMTMKDMLRWILMDLEGYTILRGICLSFECWMLDRSSIEQSPWSFGQTCSVWV